MIDSVRKAEIDRSLFGRKKSNQLCNISRVYAHLIWAEMGLRYARGHKILEFYRIGVHTFLFYRIRNNIIAHFWIEVEVRRNVATTRHSSIR
jgi:hypothetical protein